MKPLFISLLLLGLAVPAWAWEEAPKGGPLKITGTVKHLDLEGGFWGIVGDDGQNYDPTHLAPEFQKEGLRVSLEAVPSQNQVSFHMWGAIIEIRKIARLAPAGAAKGQPFKAQGTVKRQGIEGGFWGIVSDDGQNYDPATPLAPEFQKEGLRVYVEGLTQPDAVSIHQWGTVVNLKKVSKLGRSGSPMDTLKAAVGAAQAEYAPAWEATKRVLAARGDSASGEEKLIGDLATKPHALTKDALLASFPSQVKPEDCGYTSGTYELLIYLTPRWRTKTEVEVRARIMAYGTPHSAMARPSAWEQVPSNGKIEKEVLKAIQAEAKKKR